MTPLWHPANPKSTSLYRFWQQARQVSSLPLPDYNALHHWSVANKSQFWQLVWQFCHIKGEPGDLVYQPKPNFEDCRFFPQARLNFADNLLTRDDDHPALVTINEAGKRETISYKQLRDQAGRVAAGLLAEGIQAGDRVAAFLPNGKEAIITALGCAWIGALFSSCSPDFGTEGVVDRFSQINPKVLVCAAQTSYNGKTINLEDKNTGIIARIKPRLTLMVDSTLTANHHDTADVTIKRFDHWLDHDRPAPSFAMLPFDHPLFILYSSGTTGKPKCIVHGAGGTLLQHAKEHRLQGDLGYNDTLFYYTTCGWMMWNWLLSGLQAGATLILYDGNPAYPSVARLFDLVDSEAITHFGTSAKFLQHVEKSGLRPIDSHSLASMRTLYTTGSPLLHESFDFVYQQIKPDLQLSSISGGTDIISCFVLGNPCLPTWRGELQCAGLGMDIAVLDDNGQPTTDKGELACLSAFPSKPIYFWNDDDGTRYHSAYFSRFNNIWAHGDYAEPCPHEEEGHTGYIIHGRSDAVLNPGGVRIGTAEIYRQVETLESIKEALVIGQNWQGDQRVVLFVVMQQGHTLDDDLRQHIKQTIRHGASPRHVPAVILTVAALPRTVSGKIVELAVRQIVHGETVKNRHALANPEALTAFANRPELQ